MSRDTVPARQSLTLSERSGQASLPGPAMPTIHLPPRASLPENVRAPLPALHDFSLTDFSMLCLTRMLASSRRFATWALLPAVALLTGCEQKGPSTPGGSGSPSVTPGAAALAPADPKAAPISPAVAADVAPKADDKPQPKGVSTEAKQVLADWYAAVTAAKSLSADAAAKFVVLKDGSEVQAVSEAYKFALQRPDLWSLKLVKSDEDSSVSLVNDGKQLLTVDAGKKVYTLGLSIPPANWSKSLVLTRALAQQGLPLVADAVGGMSLDALCAKYEFIEYVGLEVTSGGKQHHLRALAEGVHHDFWFDSEKPHALRKAQPNAAEMAAKNGRGSLPPGIQLNLYVTFDGWQYDAPASADAFTITPPTDYDRLENIDDPLAMTLVGKAAPAFEAPLLDGGTFKLADQKGKIVVLDFWATWCPPCVAGLPKLAEMTAKYKADGVVFYPINLQEDPATVKAFLEEKKLELPIVKDEGAIVAKYKVSGVPQTVFIDREGVVQVVHVGIGELEAIPKQLADLVAGKSLAHVKPTAEKK
ncbi:MAG: hypothetical protein C0483_02065 [Pirellula sp.]|nr:hypothetical protein [Pirellula sp.]